MGDTKKRKNKNKQEELENHEKAMKSDDPYRLDDSIIRDKVTRRRLTNTRVKLPKLYNEET